MVICKIPRKKTFSCGNSATVPGTIAFSTPQKNLSRFNRAAYEKTDIPEQKSSSIRVQDFLSEHE
jgi:hypothetical protein